jgi:hypothetical protein
VRVLQDRFPNAQLISGDKKFERRIASSGLFPEN